jgi:methanogenic corrinoid protein MtbC1
MAGCAAIMEAFAREIGADGYAQDAGTAVEKAKMLLGRK